MKTVHGAVSLALLCLSLPVATAHAAAVRAHDALMTWGVNTHFDFNSYGYQSLPVAASNITYLGLKVLRDSPQVATDAVLWLAVSQATGAKFDAYIAETSPTGMILDMGYFTALNAAGVLMAIEGGNEEDDAYPVSLGNTLAGTAQFQQLVYALGQILHLPVINMSFGAGWTATNNWQGDYGAVGDLSAYATWGNAHTYPLAGQTPSYAIQTINALAKLTAPARPVATTEIGWDVTLFSQAIIAKYALDASLDAVLYGNPGLYFYALYDDGSGQWGFFNADGTPRPAATALHNLTTLIADTGATAATFTPGLLTFTLTGTTSGDSSQIIAKSNGTYWLALWNETEAANSPHTVTVGLPAAASAVTLYDPLVGTTAVQSWSNVAAIAVPVTDHPTLLAITPAPITVEHVSAPPLTGPQITAPGNIGVAAGARANVVGIGIADAFAAGNPGTLALNVNAGSGTIGTTDASGAKLPGSDTGAMTLSLTWSQLAAALGNIYYTAPPAVGSATISVNIWDQAGNQSTQIIKVTVQ